MVDTSRGVWALQKAMEVVDSRSSDVEKLTDKYLGKLDEAIGKMTGISQTQISIPQVNLPSMPDGISIDLGKPPIAPVYSTDGPSEPVLASEINLWLRRLREIESEPLPDAPVMPTLQLPAAPLAGHVSAPDRPNIDTRLTIPDAPALALPDLGALRDIPDFDIQNLPDFDGRAPTLDFVPPDVFIHWKEPQYTSEVYDSLVEQIRRWMAGGTGLPVAVEDALFWRARERDNEIARAAQQEAIDTWAARGFSLPPGMLNKSLDVIRDKSRAQTAALNRDIMIEAAKWEIDNLRHAVTQGIALEGLTMNLFENMAKRLFEVAKFRAESQITLYNARVGLFNAQLEGFRITAQIFETRLRAALARLDVFKARVQAASEYNQGAVEVFKAKYEGVRQVVEMYKARMDGARLRADVIKSLFDGWRTEVQAYSERLIAEKLKFDAYDSQIRAESAKAGMFEAQAKAYATTVQAVAARSDVKIKGMHMNIEAARLMLQKYSTDASVYSTRVQAATQRTDSAVRQFSAQVEAWRAGLHAKTSQAEIKARVAEASARLQLSFAELQLGQYKIHQQQADLQAQLAMEAAKAAGQYTAQVAAGALSALNVSASISGTGSQSGVDQTNRTEEYIYHNGG